MIVTALDGEAIFPDGLTFANLVDIERVERYDVLCIPGGVGCIPAMENRHFMQAIRRLASEANYLTSVCTGSLVLGAAGVLKGRRSACHWAWRDMLSALGAMPEDGRVIRDGNVITGGGATAGVDFALILIAKLWGAETARRLKENRVRFYIGARQSERGIEAASLLAVEWLHLDVTDEASMRDADVRLGEREGSLDILVNNAGIAGSRKPAAELTGDDAEAVFATNVVGPVRVMNAFLPLMQTSSNLVIVNVSSGLRSFTVTQDTQRFESRVLIPLYCASKSALNMLTLQYARAIPNFRVNAADPGYTATDLNGHRGQQTVEEGTDAIICLTTLPRTAWPAGFWIAAGPYFGKRFGEPSRSLCEGPSIR